MSFRPFLLGLAAVAALLGPAAARAADLDDSFSYAEAPEPLPQAKVEFGTGWYVRGDLGASTGLSIAAGNVPYSKAAINNPTYVNEGSFTEGVFEGPGTVAPGLSSRSSISPIAVATLGAGYQFNRWFRADITADFRQPIKSTYQGQSVRCITGTQGLPDANGKITTENIISTNCTPDLQAYLQSFSVLANGYFDLGTWYNVTPYVGGGIGLSFGHAHAISTYYQNNSYGYANISYTDAVSGSTFVQNWDRSRTTTYYNLAFAAMAGVAIDIYPHTKLDLGYRYLHLGQVLGTKLNAQEARAGLRYMIDN